MEYDKPLPIDLIIISCLIVAGFVTLDIINGGFIIPSFISGGISVFCGIKCYKLSTRNGNKGYGAYAFGVVLGLLGLLIYWIIYKIERRKHGR